MNNGQHPKELSKRISRLENEVAKLKKLHYGKDDIEPKKKDIREHFTL